MRALVGCEYSGVIRDALSERGWDAWSCDLLPTESEMTKKEGKHIRADVRLLLNDGWDLFICHPPCTYTTVAGNRYIPRNPERWKRRNDAIMFAWELFNADIEFVGLEQPISVLSTYLGKPNQIIHPYYFGDPVPKRTCLWLKNLPNLKYTNVVEPEYIEYNSKKTKSGKSRYSIYGRLGKGHGHERSKTFQGIANAMADQWSEYIIKNRKL